MSVQLGLPKVKLGHYTRPEVSGLAPLNTAAKFSITEYPLRVLAALSWLFWSSRLFIEIGTFPTAPFWSILFGFGAVILLVLYALLRSERSIAILDRILVYGTLIIGIVWVVALVYGNPNYGTDEAAFVQGAAHTFIHGQDPYGTNLSWTLQHFAVQPNAYTYTTSGRLITQLNYPALSFLPEAALIAAGVSGQATIWICAFFLAVSGVLLFAVMPPRFRPLAAILLGFDAYFDSAASGLIFTEMMVFIILAVASWEHFVSQTPGWRRWISPLALGLAISIQQDSWFLVPCFLVAVYQEGRMDQQRPWPFVIRYCLALTGTFLVINALFIVDGPSAFIHGILEPFTLSLMPLGQGLIGLTTYLGIGGGDLFLYTLTSLLVLALLLFLLGFAYHTMRFLVPLTPAIVLWFSTRSLSQYVLIAAYSLLAAVCCWRPRDSALEMPHQPRGSHAKTEERRSFRFVASVSVAGITLIGFAVAASLGTLALALSSKAPLSIRVISYHSTGQEQTIDSLNIEVRNNTNRVKRAVYVVENGPYVGTPWLLATAQKDIPPHGRRTLKILAPNTAVMPSLNSDLKVAGFTSGPSAVSTSDSFLPNNDHTLLTPFGYSAVIPLGRSMTVNVQVLDRLGSAVNTSGIEVELGQEIYAPTGLFASENSINGHPDGQSPVAARTNSRGIATFHIRADQLQASATTLQAWLGTSGASGYSNRVIAWFGYSKR